MVTSPRTKITLRLSDARLWQQLDKLAQRINRSLNFTAEQCLKSGLAELAEGEPHVIPLAALERPCKGA